MTRLLAKLKAALARPAGWAATVPFRFTGPEEVEPPPSVCHSRWPATLRERFNRPGMRVLEIGSRNVTGSNFRSSFSEAHYVGFDLYPGENVDIVGDAHRLSAYFAPHERFDLIFSSAVFEHLYMPWIVVEQIARLLDVGGHVFVETHFSFSAHGRPWNFFQFSDMGLRALFNPALGFEVIEAGMSDPIAGYFTQRAAPYLRYGPVRQLYCHSEILCRKTREVSDFRWSTLGADEVAAGTRYPDPR
jgi:SAM-dependent methyltransferase